MSSKTPLYGTNDKLGLLLSQWRLSAVQPYVKGRLLDLACGDNRLVKEHRQSGGDGVGVDVSDYGADIVTQDFGRLPIESGSVDTVTIVASINYFPEPEPVLKEVARVLRPGGTVLVTMSNSAILKIWHRFREPWAHKSGLTKDEMVELFGGAGFRLKRRTMFMMGINFIYEFESAERKAGQASD